MVEKRYYLMHQNAPIALLTHGLSVLELYDRAQMPLGICPKDIKASAYLTEQRLKTWFAHRTIPENRQFAKELQTMLGTSFTELMIKSLSISLTDTYWLCPEELLKKQELTWEMLNFHQNGFSNKVAESYLCSGKVPIDFPHPTFTTDGILKKTWVRLEDGKPYLLKFDERNHRAQLIGEVFASRLSRLLHIPHASYSAIRVNGQMAVICPCIITDADIDMTYAMQYRWAGNLGSAELFPLLHSMDKEGISRMIVLDACTLQSDRHEYNFAFANHKLLPLYDSGRCFGNGEAKPFAHTHAEQLRLLDACPIKLPDIQIILELYKEASYECEVKPDESVLMSLRKAFFMTQNSLDKLGESESLETEVFYDGYGAGEVEREE